MPKKRAKRKPAKKSLKRKNADIIKSLEERTMRLIGKDYQPITMKELKLVNERIDSVDEDLSVRLKRLESAFISFSDAVEGMKKEQKKLIKQKEKLEAKNNELEMRIAGVDVGAIATAAADKVQRSMHENVAMVQHAVSGKEADYEDLLEMKDAAMDLSEEDKLAVSLMKKGGKRYLNKVQDNNLVKLYLFVRDNKIIKTSDAAMVLKIDEGTITGLAETLYENKLIKMQYPAFGKPMLSKK
ncbi:hypothetical protein CL614_02385 [archaeon]|nr:hypothetical protein [archaeon]|tara:strand:- start:167 stop:892 length:726 start_codon:yes stop_codon:yes gene_type:complete